MRIFLNRRRSSAGFTLIELLIYSTLISIVIGGSLGAVYQILQNTERLNREIMIEQDAFFIKSKILWALNGSEVVNFPISSSSGNFLSINNPSSSANPVIFEIMGDDLIVKRGGLSALPLNNDRFAVSELLFSRQSFATSSAEVLSASFKIEDQSFFFSEHLKND